MVLEKKAETLVVRFRRVWRRRKSGFEMRENQCLETHLRRTSDRAGTKRRICVKRSSISATLPAAEVDEKLGGEEELTLQEVVFLSIVGLGV